MNFEKWLESYAPTAPERLDDCAKAAWEAATRAVYQTRRMDQSGDAGITFKEWMHTPQIFRSEREMLEAAWNAATLAERDAYAKIAETASHNLGGYKFAAEAIRARTE